MVEKRSEFVSQIKWNCIDLERREELLGHKSPKRTYGSILFEIEEKVTALRNSFTTENQFPNYFVTGEPTKSENLYNLNT